MADTRRASHRSKPSAENDEEEGEDVSGELAHLDQSNIIEGGRRTRGKKVDYAALDNGAEEDDEEDEGDVTVDEETARKQTEEAEGDDDEAGEDEGDDE